MKIKQSITQVQDGRHYRGTIEIVGKELEWEIKFAVPIPELDAETERKKELKYTEVRRLFQITIRRSGHKLDTRAKDTFAFLLQYIAMFAVAFYNEPYTRDSNEGRLQEYVSAVAGSVEFGMSREIDIPQEHIPASFLN